MKKTNKQQNNKLKLGDALILRYKTPAYILLVFALVVFAYSGFYLSVTFTGLIIFLFHFYVKELNKVQ